MKPLEHLKSIIQSLSVEELASRIDHAVLAPWHTLRDAEQALEELEKYRLRCLITTPTLARELASRTKHCVGAVVGFPFGYSTVEAKIKELEDVIGYGAREADIVFNYHAYLSGRREEALNEAKALVEICRETGVTCKIILEVPALPSTETATELAREVAKIGPAYLKTSTGYGPRHTQPEDVLALRQGIIQAGQNGKVGVKAAGGIRTAIQALAMIIAGADIIGTSTPAAIVEGYQRLRRDLA